MNKRMNSDCRNIMDHSEQIHTTEMGAERIRRNLGLPDDADAAAWCRMKIQSPDASVEQRGKNWYIRTGGCEITVNASSCTIITAHRIAEKG